ncbi:MAG: hypoxanthine phosphoribosyltransferase [Taibaiella sp.]|nr:hypoxanthine phosphoribosyltransferase [Taibaiella sp.]
MDRILLHDKVFAPYISADAITDRIAVLGRQISIDYEGRDPLFLAILNGSFIFAADLFRAITIPAEISFIKLASYKGTSSSGNIITAIGMDEELDERHVVIVEDIVDTGKTMHELLQLVHRQHPASVSVASFLTKPSALMYPIAVQYTGFICEDKFLVGYGLDYDKLGRGLPALYIETDQ